MPIAPRSAMRQNHFALMAWIAAGILLVPLALVQIPPLLDYPDHLAKMFVLAFGPTDPVIARVYSTHWAVIANLGVELVMPWLLAVIPLYVAGKLFLALALLLPFLGTLAFSRAAFGEHLGWPLAAGLVAYNSLFLLGFMNFLIGCGLALLAAAGWIAWRERHPVALILLLIPGTVVLFFVHLFGLLFFGLLAGGHELATLFGWPPRWPGLLRLVRRAAIDAVIFVIPAGLYLISSLAAVEGDTLRLSLRLKLAELTGPFLTYFQTPDRIVALAVFGFVALCLVLRRARVAPAAVIAFVVLLLIWPAVPHVYKSIGYVDARFPIMMGFLLFAGFAPSRLPRRLTAVLAPLVAIVFLLRMAAVADVWYDHTVNLTELRQAIAPIPPGAQVLAVDVPMQDVIPYWLAYRRSWMTAAYVKTYYHLAALVIPERRAFWPRLFTGLGKQPVVVNPPFLALTAPEGELPDFHELERDTPSATALHDAPYLDGWQTKFDYVLVLAAAAAGPELDHLRPDLLQPLVRTKFATLFRINRPPS
jgi:hypothetical protein